MKPLSIEELKRLKIGDWVWLTDETGHLGRYVAKTIAPIKEYDKTFNFDSLSGSYTYSYFTYGTIWLAYKNKEQAECKGTLIELPCEIVLSDYDKSKIPEITAEKINFSIGQEIYKVYDTVIHFTNKPPKKTNYELISGIVRNVYHIYNNYNHKFKVIIDLANEQGHHRYISQENCFLIREQAEQKLKELRGSNGFAIK